MLAPRPAIVRELSDLLHRGLGITAFFDALDRTMGEVVPFDASCWLGLDPATLLPTSHFTRETEVDQMMEVAANEILDEDVNKFTDLAKRKVPVGLLSEATAGAPELSKRYRDILVPHGFAHGDELRAVFLDDGSAWGCVTLHRREGAFSRAEAETVADLGATYIAEGIHRAVMTTTLRADGGTNVPGLILVGPDGVIESMTRPAARMLDELVDSTQSLANLPLMVSTLVTRVRRAQAGAIGEMATARLPRRSGGWLVLYGSTLGDVPETSRVGIMVYPEDAPQLPPAVAAAYALSSREQEVSSLVLQGFSTRDIAERLHLSQYTVQDHLKKIFSKVGVRSRRDLVAQIFREHYAPRLTSVGHGFERHPPH